jgi:solute:Na+ symporter, SSS family
LAQRMLTARSPLRGGLSLIISQFIYAGVVALFLVIGLLLYIFYSRPDLMGSAAPQDMATGGQKIYTQFLLNHLPTGLAGLAIAGMFAAAQGSLDSAINAMASSAVADLYWPMRQWLGKPVDKGTHSKAPRLAVLLMGLLLIGVAVVTVFVYNPNKQTLINFALEVMNFPYTGMLGVFLTALLTRRGSTWSILAALATGVLVTTLFQDVFLARWSQWFFDKPVKLSGFWLMPIGTIASFAVCCLGKPRANVHRVSVRGFPVDLKERL